MTTNIQLGVRGLDSLRREVDQALSNYRIPPRAMERMYFQPARVTTPHVPANWYSDDDHYYLELVAPGAVPDSLNITCQQGVLHVEGEKAAPCAQAQPANILRNERGAGRFLRSFRLPEGVDAERIEASYRDGQLMITMPKQEEVKAKKIPVAIS